MMDLGDAALHATLHRTAKELGVELGQEPGNFRDMIPYVLEEMAHRLTKLEKSGEKHVRSKR